MAKTKVPKLSKLLAWGTIDDFYKQIPAIVSGYKGSQLDEQFDCGHWVLSVWKCRVTEDPNCSAPSLEIASGRTCEGIQGLDRLTFDIRDYKNIWEPAPKTSIHTTWIPGASGGGSYIRETIEYDSYLDRAWECGDKYQAPCCIYTGGCTTDSTLTEIRSSGENPNNNLYRWWVIRIYDFDNTSSDYQRYNIDDPESPNPLFPRCEVCQTTGPVEPVEECRTCGCGDYTRTICNTNPEQLFNDWNACQELTNDPAFREEYNCDPEPPEKPPVTPQKPPLTPPPENPWGSGGGGVWDVPPRGENNPPVIGGGGGGWGGGGGGGGGGFGGPSGGGGGGPSEPPKGPIRLPRCSVTVRVDCEAIYKPNLRVVAPGSQVPMIKDTIETGIDEVKGLNDATYYTNVT